MTRLRRNTHIACFANLIISLPVLADDYLWQFSNIFSNVSGTVQYIELTSAASGQGQLKNRTVVSKESGVVKVYVFPENLVGETSGSHLLLATREFSTLTGLTPDFIIPDQFLPFSGGSLSFADGLDVIDIPVGALPLNGSQAMSRSGVAVDGNPENFAGLTVSVSVDSWAIFDEQRQEFSLPLLQIPGAGLANVSFTVDLPELKFTLNDDFYFYRPGVAAGSTPALLEKDGSVYVPAVVMGADLFEIRFSIVGENPTVLGNPSVLSISPALPARGEVPIPVTREVASIKRGEIFYAELCANCHGVNAQGGSATALTYSPDATNLGDLRREIATFMPYQNTNLCLDTESDSCAEDVTNFLLDLSTKLLGNQ